MNKLYHINITMIFINSIDLLLLTRLGIHSFIRFCILYDLYSLVCEITSSFKQILMSNLYPLNLKVLLKPTNAKHRELAF